MKWMKTVIVEDEPLGREVLIEKLKHNCDNVKIVGECASQQEAIKVIQEQMPDLVFLDIQLGPDNGLDILKSLDYVNFEIIITTEHNKYGGDALNAGAVYFLQKPIDEEELVTAVYKAWERIIKRTPDRPRVVLPYERFNYRVVDLDEIIYCEANNQRCKVYLYGNQEVDTNRKLKNFRQSLYDYSFRQINRKHLINLEYLKSYSRKDGGYVVMRNGTRLDYKNGFDNLGNILI